MFRELINRPIDPIPIEYVNTLQRLDSEPDYSLTCLGIALLKPRIEDYGGITGVYASFDKETSCLTDFINRRIPAIDTHPMFCYYKYSYVSDDDKTTKEKLEENGFEIKETIGALIKDKANIKCIAAFHKEKNCAVIFINSQDIRFYHMLISFMSLLFPSLFKSIPLKQPEDYNLIKSLSKTDKDAFMMRIQESVKDYAVEFRRLMLEQLLKAMHEAKITKALNEVTSQRNYVNNMESEYTNAISRLKELIAMYEGMRVVETYDKPEEELIEYLATNKNVRNLVISGNQLSFTVATLLNNYNATAWETFMARGYILDGQYRTRTLDAFADKNNRKILLNSIFSESPTFAVKMAGNYTLNLDSCHISTSRGFDYESTDPIFKTYVPNPHLKLFSCLGGYESRVVRALRDRNYIGAIEMCCASAGSVNLDETEQTFRPFLGWVLSSREKILRRLEDGVDMTPEEALIYLVDGKKDE